MSAILDTEREIIATLSSGDACRKYWDDGISANLFADSRCRAVYSWAMEYFAEHGHLEIAPTKEVIFSEFPDYEQLISEATGAAPSYLSARLKNEYTKRETEAVLKLYLPNMPDDALGTATMIRDSMTSIVDNCASESFCIEYGKDMEAYRRRVDEYRKQDGIPYPFDEMTKWTGGMKRGELCIIVGPPSYGKTLTACLSALKALECGKNVYFASLELTIENIAQRIEYIAVNQNGLKVPISEYQHGVSVPQWDKAIAEAQDYIAGLPGKLFIEQPRVEDRTPTALVQACKSKGCDLLIVDQLQFVTKPRRDSLQESYGAALQEFKQQIMTPADGVRIPLLLLHQMNREGVKGQNKTSGHVGSMTDIAGSAWVEQIADIVWGIGRNEEERNNNVMNIATLKARNCAPVGWKLYWDASYGYQFHELLDELGKPIRLTEWMG